MARRGRLMDGMVIAAGIVLVLLIWFISIVNRFARLRNMLKESWSSIDVALKRRYDLIPNLVETARGYAAHEQAVFERVAKAREVAASSVGPAADQARDENELVHALSGLMVRLEAYPELKASKHFMELQRELAKTEDRIAAARRFYNANVREYNTLLHSFPSGMIGASFGHVDQGYFEIDPVEGFTPIVGAGTMSHSAGGS